MSQQSRPAFLSQLLSGSVENGTERLRDLQKTLSFKTIDKAQFLDSHTWPTPHSAAA